MDQPLLTAKSLKYNAETSQTISLTLNAGDRIGLLGDSEARLSILLQVLAGLRVPLAGHLELRGREVRHPRQLRQHVRLVWHNPYVLFGERLSVRDLLFGRRKRVSEEDLQTGGLPSAAADFELQSLSGVQRIRVALIHLHQQRPDVLLVDDIFQAIIPEAWDGVLKSLTAAITPTTALLVASRYPEALQTMHMVYRITEAGIMPMGREAASGVTEPAVQR